MSSYESKSSEIRELANHPDPNMLADSLTKSTEGLHHVAPNISQSLQILGTRALGYLNQKMPKPSNEMIGDSEWEPGKSQKSHWMGLHDIVNDPVSALDHVRHGTLTSEHMDALSQVHPELLDQMRQKVMENMDPKAVKKLPSTTKISLSRFLGSPVSGNLTPQAILANQMTFQAKAQQQAGGKKGPKSTLGGLKSLNLGKRAATDTTELEEEPL